MSGSASLRRRTFRLAAAFLTVGTLAVPSAGVAQTVDVHFTATPDFNDWLLEFTVRNNIGPGVRIWSFGVHISSGSDIPSFGVPAGWFDAGSGPFYNNNWSTDALGTQTVDFGQMLSGFIARDNDSVDAPQSVEWIAYTIDDNGVMGSLTGTALVAPADPLSDLEALAISMAGDEAVGRALTATLHAARHALDDGNSANDVAAIGALSAFVNRANAVAGRTLTQAQADQLISLAQAIIDALEPSPELR